MLLLRPAGLKPSALRKTAALGLALLAAAWLPAQAHAQVNATILPVFTPGTPSTFTYTLTNTGTETIGEFDLAVPPTSALTNITAPTGFIGLYTTGDTFVQWLSTDPSTDITAGQTLGGFSFQTTAPAGTDSFLVRNADNGDSRGGSTVGPGAPPAAVPEPSSMAAFSCGTLGLAGLILAARRKKANVRASA